MTKPRQDGGALREAAARQEAMSETGKTAKQTAQKRQRRRDGKFQKGTAPGPGRPRGRRDAASVLASTQRVEELAAEELDEIVRGLRDAAKAGDVQAGRLLLERAAPARKGTAISFNLPRIGTVDDLRSAYNDVLAGVGAGDLTLEEASQLFGLLEHHRRMLETVELQRRLEQLEETAGGGA